MDRRGGGTRGTLKKKNFILVLIGSVNTSDTRRFAFNVQNTRRDSVYEAYDEAHPRAVSHP